jgi:ribosomal protein S27AE
MRCPQCFLLLDEHDTEEQHCYNCGYALYEKKFFV